jgi:hypothetical protein
VLNDIRTYKTLNIEQLHQNEAEIKKIIETLQENIINRTNEISETVLQVCITDSLMSEMSSNAIF